VSLTSGVATNVPNGFDRARSGGPGVRAGLSSRRLRRVIPVAAAVLLTAGLRHTPHQASIPPLVESDYAYQLIAADRLFEGKGLTSLQPVAPHQPWSWEYDWGFLTQWPAGYPLLICGVRAFLGGSSLGAARLIGAAACAFALVGWFVLATRFVPNGVTRYVLAAVTAGLAVPASSLINPSTDALVTAALPWFMLALADAVGTGGPRSADTKRHLDWVWLVLIGLAAGTFCWIRYAAVFVPVGAGLYLAITALTNKRVTCRAVLAYTAAAAAPIVTLLVVNSWLSAAKSTQAQLNLGNSLSLDFSLGLIASAWSNFTALGFYDHRPAISLMFAVWPLALAAGLVISPRARAAAKRFLCSPAVGSGAALVATLLAMLVVATALFGEKFDYAGLDRYYLPAKPLYCLLFVAPILLIRRRIVRTGLCAALCACVVWTIQVEWSRPLQRWHAAERRAAPSGAWSRTFEPGASTLFAWLRGQRDPSLIVVSNFHEYLTLETGVATLPIPPDQEELGRWVNKIAEARGITEPRVLFALDPDNKWRSHWISNPGEVEREFALAPYPDEAGDIIHPSLFGYPIGQLTAAHGDEVTHRP